MRSCSSFDEPILVNFSRQYLNQTGNGHFSSIGGYNEEEEQVLVLEIARFKYPPFWVDIRLLWESMRVIASNSKTDSSGKKITFFDYLAFLCTKG